MKNVMDTLRERGFIKQTVFEDELYELLGKESVRTQLARRQIPQTQIERFTALIAQCEQAQYSPQAGMQMPEVYSQGVVLISKFESAIGKKSTPSV